MLVEKTTLVERTITQLKANRASTRRASELGQLGYMQWLGGLPAAADYISEAEQAYGLASRFMAENPPLAEFCKLLRQSIQHPLKPLDLALPRPRRRGGARSRRQAL